MTIDLIGYGKDYKILATTEFKSDAKCALFESVEKQPYILHSVVVLDGEELIRFLTITETIVPNGGDVLVF